MIRPLLLGGDGRMPFVGFVRGALASSTSAISWIGRIGTGEDIEAGWQTAQALQRCLLGKGVPEVDRRQLLSGMWSRVDAMGRELASAGRKEPLVMLLVAQDAQGVSISGVGLGCIYAVRAGLPAEAWVAGAHPLLCESGFPTKRPGAMTLQSAPPWLIAVQHERVVSLAGVSLTELLPRCGVRA